VTEERKTDELKGSCGPRESETYGLGEAKVYAAGFSAYLPAEETDKLVQAWRTTYPCTVVTVQENATKEPSRELKILRAALAIGTAFELDLGSGPLHCLIEDGNYDGDISVYRANIEVDFACRACSEAQRDAAHACIDALESLSDDERIAAEWLYLRALRWNSWDFRNEPE
jgi:hypothetical protein